MREKELYLNFDEYIRQGEQWDLRNRYLHIHATKLPGASVPQPSAMAALIFRASSDL